MFGLGRKSSVFKHGLEAEKVLDCQNAVEKIIMMFKTSTVTFFCEITFSLQCFIWIIILAEEKCSYCRN